MKKQKTYSRRNWTEKEDNYMFSKYTKQAVAITAERLNRSIPSVKHRAAKLGLNHYLDNLGAKTIAKCFNVDYSVVKRWIEKYDLPFDRIKHSKNFKYDIDVLKFWKWAEKNKEIINWSKYERRSLAPEPEWVKNEYSSYKNVNSRKRITEDEIQKVKRLWMKGYSNKEISDEMKRSIDSIKHIIRKMEK